MANKQMEIPKSRNWFLIFLILFSLYLLSSIFSSFTQGDIEEYGNVAVIPIKGIILADGSNDPFGMDGASATEIVEMLEKAKENENIKAVILEINSPGGSGVASEEIANAIKDLNKTSVAWIREVGASGAYWAASATDHIVASRMSFTGSIGVISSYLEFSELLENFNITYRRLVAGKYKDMGSPFKELTKEEEKLWNNILEESHDYFIETVAENRDMSKEGLKKSAEGQVFLGGEALELGLVDEIGSKDEAIAYIEKELNITADLAYYSVRKSLLDIFSGLTSNHGYSMGMGLQGLKT